ncbi:MAG: tRNA dihydrouridine synthase DusB [Clostridia bacterium]|nr:tRNA dihydrouridine synthase DusB [Clostridia bacterium]
MKIRDLDFRDGLILAPMAGVSDVGFRDLCSIFGADATYTEMLSSKAMNYNPTKTEFMTVTSENERIKVAQIFGHESEIMAKAVNNPMLDGFDIIDMNFGCPAHKIISNNEGSALMKDLKLSSEIITSVVKASDRPVSVKIRKGFDKDNSLEFARMCEECGVSFLTIHGRTAEQGYSGKADLECIAKVKANLKIPVVGNGDVVDVESYKKMKETGVDAVMIGRGTQGYPEIFFDIKNYIHNENKKLSMLKYEIIKHHIEYLRKHYEEDWLKLYMRKHLLWYIKDFAYASEIRRQIATSPSLDESLKLLKNVLK